MTPTDTQRRLMRHAAHLSQQKMEAGAGGPFGALIAREGEIVAEGWNKVTSSHDPTAHAEIVAIRNACAALGTFSLAGCEIYTSCEPCPMCLSAIYWARLDRIWYANTRDEAAAIGFDDEFLYREVALPMDQRSLPILHLRDDQATAAFQAWMAKADRVPY